MAQEIIDCDVVIQAGHENTPDDRTGGEGPLGREIDWTPIVANEAVRLLKEAGVDYDQGNRSYQAHATEISLQARVVRSFR